MRKRYKQIPGNHNGIFLIKKFEKMWQSLKNLTSHDSTQVKIEYSRITKNEYLINIKKA